LRWNCLLKHIIEENIEEKLELTGRPEIRGRQLLDDLKEKKVYCKLKEEALYCTVKNSLPKRL
jgi:hypothetical protein